MTRTMTKDGTGTELAPDSLMQLATAFWTTKTVTAAVEFNLFGVVSDAGGMTVEDVADALQIMKGQDYGGCGSRLSPVWAKNASIRSGRYWMRLSRFFTIAMSWSMPCTIRFPRLRLTWDQTCSVGLRSGA